jgi:IS605 OrfB family transposase
VRLLHSRQRLVAVLGAYEKAALKGPKPTSATPVNRRDGCYFLHVQVKDEAPGLTPTADHLGVDLGIARIAADSDGESYSGRPVEDVRRKHNLQRKRFQRRGTTGAKKKPRRTSGKEGRFRRHENHVISRRLVETAKRTGRGLALEDLRGIRERVRARGGEARNRVSGWSFRQPRGFIDYKASAAGIPVVAVDPRNTSRTRSQRGHRAKGNHNTQESFVCLRCGFSCNADWNAAKNIRSLAQADRNAAFGPAGLVPSRKPAGL